MYYLRLVKLKKFKFKNKIGKKKKKIFILFYIF